MNTQPTEAYDFFIGKKARRRARRRKKNRMERREAKTDSLKVANEERRLRNKIMRKTMLEDDNVSHKTATVEVGNTNAPLPKTGVHPWLWVAGVLLVVGVLYRRSR